MCFLTYSTHFYNSFLLCVAILKKRKAVITNISWGLQIVDPTTLFSSLFRSRHAIPSFPLRLSGRFCLIEHAVDEQIVRDEMFICVNFLPLVQYSTVRTIKQLAMVPFVPMGKKFKKETKTKKHQVQANVWNAHLLQGHIKDVPSCRPHLLLLQLCSALLLCTAMSACHVAHWSSLWDVSLVSILPTYLRARQNAFNFFCRVLAVGITFSR